MFKFTDVTASHVYKTVKILFPLNLQTITVTLDVVRMSGGQFQLGLCLSV